MLNDADAARLACILAGLAPADRGFLEALVCGTEKLLTGFDAPSCTYIYLDHELRDHNLFQAICRTNRLDGNDKEYGYIVDFEQLFENVQRAIAIYNSDELDADEGNGGSNNVELKDWLKEGRKQLDAAREVLRYLPSSLARSAFGLGENRRRGHSARWYGPNNEVTLWECDRSPRNATGRPEDRGSATACGCSNIAAGVGPRHRWRTAPARLADHYGADPERATAVVLRFFGRSGSI